VAYAPPAAMYPPVIYAVPQESQIFYGGSNCTNIHVRGLDASMTDSEFTVMCQE
jgi:hypothetical protein